MGAQTANFNKNFSFMPKCMAGLWHRHQVSNAQKQKECLCKEEDPNQHQMNVDASLVHSLDSAVAMAMSMLTCSWSTCRWEHLMLDMSWRRLNMTFLLPRTKLPPSWRPPNQALRGVSTLTFPLGTRTIPCLSVAQSGTTSRRLAMERYTYTAE